jgi:hypothetical protein
VRIVGHADSARFGDALKAGSKVDAITEDVVAIENDVTDVNADAKFDPLVLRHGGILLGHSALDFNGTTHRIDGAGKLDQHAVAGGFDDVAAMFGDGGIDERLPERLELRQRAFFVAAHQTAIAGDIRR